MSEHQTPLTPTNGQSPAGGQPPQNEDGKKYLFDNPRNVKLVVRGLLVSCAIMALLDLVIHRHHDHPWEAMFAFYPVYGFVSCVLLVLAAKQLRKVVMRAENYYDEYPLKAPDGGPDYITGDDEIDHGGEHVGHASEDMFAHPDDADHPVHDLHLSNKPEAHDD